MIHVRWNLIYNITEVQTEVKCEQDNFCYIKQDNFHDFINCSYLTTSTYHRKYHSNLCLKLLSTYKDEGMIFRNAIAVKRKTETKRLSLQIISKFPFLSLFMVKH